ncbi:Inner membrane protein YrbG, predicted calcium/sodium:proton antiporter [hydrothermal vent metagenome]|uniref:Inner membrane protein YrbG, predicted calcium/sodium:proton antiporter n=1 Tax=hydrothermal vent metagenome TaxID=652676 RepID=A0A3B1CKZ8_9ZZZZ
MLLDIGLLAIGLTLLFFGAEYLVKGSANTAVILGVNPIVIGLTVVAFGTSMPELVVCLLAVFRESNDIAIGAVIGSNIANIGLVMAVGALYFPLAIQRRTLTRDLPFMLVTTALLFVVSYNEYLSRLDGAILFAAVSLFTGYCIYGAIKNKSDASAVEEEVKGLIDETRSLRYELAVMAAGTAGVIVGARFLVDSAASIARSFGISELVIGISIVAVGTSLPELATTAIAAMRRQSDIAVGNIIGSNIYNIGWVLGVTVFIKPIPVAWDTVTHEMLIMAGFSLALIPSAIMLRMGRIGGALMLVLYAAFIGWMALYRYSA